MLIQLDLNSETPIYLQLRNQILLGMASGQLSPGEALPSVRQLGVDLGINLHTVNKVYTLLKQEGFLTVHRQKGVVIRDDGVTAADAAYRQKLNDDMKTLLAEAFLKGLAQEEIQEIVNNHWSGFQATTGGKVC